MSTNRGVARFMRKIGAGVLPLIAAACSSDGTSRAEPEAQSEWQELIAGDWHLDAGAEDYQCVRLTLTDDVLVAGFKPLGLEGMHHTTLTLDDPSADDGIFRCGEFQGALDEMGIWATGVNTNPVEFPEAVGMVLPAGKQLLLSLHLFNTSDRPLEGHSGLAIKKLERSALVHEAGGTLMGPIGFSLPPRKTTVVEGACTFDERATIFTVLPHMHKLGTHISIVAERAGQPDHVVHDAPFDFQNQYTVPVPDLTLEAGDKLRITCTYENDTDETIAFGESTLKEMCFAATARYPLIAQPACYQ